MELSSEIYNFLDSYTIIFVINYTLPALDYFYRKISFQLGIWFYSVTD